jgi:pilus assembly protein CpaB
VWAGLTAVRAPARAAPPTVPVLVAARDLAPGTVLDAADLRTAHFPASAVPPSAVQGSVAGRTLAVAVPTGVPLTAASLALGRVLPAGTVAAPVRLADPGEAALVVPGDRVDVLAAPGSDAAAGQPTVAASDVVVLAVPAPDTDDGDQGGLLVLATTPAAAATLARDAAADRLSVTLRTS